MVSSLKISIVDSLDSIYFTTTVIPRLIYRYQVERHILLLWDHSLRVVLIIFFRVSRNLNFFENVSATVTRFELNFIHSKSVTVSLICDHIVSWSNMNLQRQLAGEDHVYIPPEYNDGLDIKQQQNIITGKLNIILKTHICMNHVVAI